MKYIVTHFPLSHYISTCGIISGLAIYIYFFFVEKVDSLSVNCTLFLCNYSICLCRKVKDYIKSNILWVVINLRNYACWFNCRCFNTVSKNFNNLNEKYSEFMSQENEMLLHMNKEKNVLLPAARRWSVI